MSLNDHPLRTKQLDDKILDSPNLATFDIPQLAANECLDVNLP